MMKIDTIVSPREISIVCQGAISPGITDQCLRSLRAAFPGAQLILSTWTGSDVSELDVDKVICSPDPGTVVVDEVVGTLNNVNRQLVSTQAGLKAADRHYILKTRTDLLFRDAGFLSYFGKYDAIPSQYFRNRLLICSYYTRNPRVFRTCFHPSDWLVFGRTEDVRAYYGNIKLMTKEESVWFKTHEKQSSLFINYISRYTPEQHIFLSFLRIRQEVTCNCYYDWNRSLAEQTEQAFAECFVVLDYKRQLDLSFPKYDPNRYLEKHTLVGHWQWRALYEHYCRKGPSALWFFSRMQALFFMTVTYARKTLIRLLDGLGIKEYVKSLLQNNRKHHASN